MRRASVSAKHADALAAWLQGHLNNGDLPEPVNDAVLAFAGALADPSVQLIEIIRDPSTISGEKISVIRQASNNPYSRTRIGWAASEAEARAVAGDVVIQNIHKMRIAGEPVWLLGASLRLDLDQPPR